MAVLFDNLKVTRRLISNSQENLEPETHQALQIKLYYFQVHKVTHTQYALLTTNYEVEICKR